MKLAITPDLHSGVTGSNPVCIHKKYCSLKIWVICDSCSAACPDGYRSVRIRHHPLSLFIDILGKKCLRSSARSEREPDKFEVGGSKPPANTIWRGRLVVGHRIIWYNYSSIRLHITILLAS